MQLTVEMDNEFKHPMEITQFVTIIFNAANLETNQKVTSTLPLLPLIIFIQGEYLHRYFNIYTDILIKDDIILKV
jgi:hypothetical protein